MNFNSRWWSTLTLVIEVRSKIYSIFEVKITLFNLTPGMTVESTPVLEQFVPLRIYSVDNFIQQREGTKREFLPAYDSIWGKHSCLLNKIVWCMFARINVSFPPTLLITIKILFRCVTYTELEYKFIQLIKICLYCISMDSLLLFLKQYQL